MPSLFPKVPPIAGVLIDALAGGVAVLAGFTGLFGGSAHYGAVLANRSARDVERMTSFGFFTGLLAGVIAIALDALA